MSPGRYVFGSLPWYSLLIVCGIILALCISHAEEKRKGLPHDLTVDLALCVLPCGIIGARLYYVIFARNSFAADPVSILYIWKGGLAIYGGLLGGLLAAFVFSRVRRIPLRVLADMLLPGVALAQAVGRWGNFFNMEAYGQVITEPAWQFFPIAVQIPDSGGIVWHQATFFYESCWDFGIFLFLYINRRRFRRDGDTALWYVLLYAAGRQLIEGLRSDSLMGGSIRISQLLSALLLTVVLVIFCIRHLRQHKRQALPALLVFAVTAVCLLASLFAGSMVFRLIPVGTAVLCGLMTCPPSGKEAA